jgi:MFS family permease
MINFASQIGKALGATYGGKLIPFGRKRAFIMFNCLAIFSMGLQQIVSTPTLCIGKFLNGFFVTVCYIASIKMLNETVPVYELGTYGILTQV